MRHLYLIALLALGGCKIVAKTETADAVPQDDASRMAALVEKDWEARILPRIRESAAPLDEVLGAIAADFDAARARYGVTSGAEGAPSVFVVRGTGKVIEANLESRAARVSVDIDGDGTADAEIQLGPVIRGTALRDGLPFYEFTAFRDQIEFAKLARALNDAAHAAMPQKPQGAVPGEVSFTGVFPMTKAGDGREIVPLDLNWTAP